MHELSAPSRLPGWTLIVGAVLAALLGVHVSLTAFAHDAVRHPGSWIWHVVSVEGWRVSGILVRCTSAALVTSVLSDPGRAPATYRRWCQQWWYALSHWAEDSGQAFFGATILLMSVGGGAAYLYASRRLIPHGPERRRTTAYATMDELRPFLRPRSVSSEEMVRTGALPLGHVVTEGSRQRGVDLWLPLRYRRQHIWMLGVTGVGKTSGIIKRWLATDALLDGIHARAKMSTVAVDVKDPDLWEFAAPFAQRYGRPVVRWAPMGPTSMGHNFLDYVHTPGDTLEMAETILTNDPEYNRKDPFWRQTELNMLATTIQLVCEEPADRLRNDLLREKMQNVLGVDPPPRSLAFILGLSHLHPSEFMAYIEHVDGPRTVWRDRYSKVFQSRDDRTIGTWQGLQNVLVIFRDPEVIAATSRSNFSLSTLTHQPTTLIIGLPRKPGSRRQILTALFLRQLLQTFGDVARAQEPQQLPVPVTLLLDELAVLGLIPTFQDFVATYRDMGVSFVVAAQDRAQLIDVYGKEKADILIANLHTRIIFGRDLRPEQAEEICRALGERIVVEPGVQYEHRSPLSVVRRGTRMTYQVRRLLEPNELRAFPEFRAVTVLPGDLKVHVDLLPVHADPAFQGAAVRINTVNAPHALSQMNHGLSQLPVPSRRTGAPEHSPGRRDALPPPNMHQSPPIRGKRLDAASRAAQSGSGELLKESPGSSRRATESTASLPANRRTAEEAKEDAPATVHPAVGVHLVGGTSGEVALTAAIGEASSADPLPGAAPNPFGIGSPLVALVDEVLRGSLRDERLLPGSPRGWVVEDKSGEFLVPWGFLRDWAFKTRRRFTDVEAAWIRDGIALGRASLMVQGRSITCVLFSKHATSQLPPQLRQILPKVFAKVPAIALRLSTARVVRAGGPDLAVLQRTAEGAPDLPRLPRLRDFLHALDQAGIHFIGHPARDREPPVHGRWRAHAKDGDQILLVERKAAQAIFAAVGVTDPVDVLRLWKQAGLLYLGGQVRGEFYTRRTHPEGNEFLALRWTQIGSYLPSRGNAGASAGSEAMGTRRSAAVPPARTTS